MMSRDKWVFPEDPELTTLQVTFPAEDLVEIDDAIGRFDRLKDREDFIFWAAQYALSSLKEEAEELAVGLEDS